MDPLYFALLLYLAALALAIVDLFIPSGGLLSIMAALAAFASVLFGFRSSSAVGMALLTLVVASIPVFVVLAIKIWPHTPLGRRIILKLPAKVDRRANLERDALQRLVGSVLVCETGLMPMGQLRVGPRRFDAVAESGFIEAGERVKVLQVRERLLVVRVTTEPVTPSKELGDDDGAGTISSDQRQPINEGNLLDRPAEELGLDSLE